MLLDFAWGLIVLNIDASFSHRNEVNWPNVHFLLTNSCNFQRSIIGNFLACSKIKIYSHSTVSCSLILSSSFLFFLIAFSFTFRCYLSFLLHLHPLSSVFFPLLLLLTQSPADSLPSLFSCSLQGGQCALIPPKQRTEVVIRKLPRLVASKHQSFKPLGNAGDSQVGSWTPGPSTLMHKRG